MRVRLSRRSDKVRVHLVETQGASLPSLEGYLVATRPDIILAIPSVLFSTEVGPAALVDAKHVVVPRERVAFYEVLR